LQKYLALRAEFAGEGTTMPLYRQMKDQARAKTLYKVAINTIQNRFIGYVSRTCCGLEPAGQEDMALYATYVAGYTPEQKRDEQIQRLFKDEIKKLEESNYVLP
jgi:hypothetical protein